MADIEFDVDDKVDITNVLHDLIIHVYSYEISVYHDIMLQISALPVC